jgi:hypothetical protein
MPVACSLKYKSGDYWWRRPFQVEYLSPMDSQWYYYPKWAAPEVLTVQWQQGCNANLAGSTIVPIFDIDYNALNFVLGGTCIYNDDVCICYTSFGSGEVNVFKNEDEDKPLCLVYFSFNTNCKDFVFYEHKKPWEFPSCNISFTDLYGNPPAGTVYKQSQLELLSQDTYGNYYTINANEELDLSLGVDVFVTEPIFYCT